MDRTTTQLVSIVGQLVGDEYRQLRGVGDQVAELSDELDTMNAILRMLSDADEGSVDHFIRVWMKQVRELAYDAEDCIHLYIFRIRCRPKDRFFVWSKRLLATLFPRRRLAREIEALRARAVVISERHARYGVGREALSRSTPPPLAAPAPVSGHALGRPAANDPDHLIGIEEQANKLADMVKAVSNKERDMKLKVFSVVGFGGLGKTTLAMEVSRQLETEFQSQAQVSVSQAFRGSGSKDLEGLLKRMLRQIVEVKADHAQGRGTMEEDPLGGIDKMGVDQLTGKLKELLKDKRYLIIVDDVWTVATWDAIKSKLPDCSNGSRVIVTTRIETVASGASVDGDCIYWIERLSPENSKKLFLSRALGPSATTLSNDLTAEMDKILKKCGGLPMAIISIASLLANYKSSESKEMWERVRKSIGSQMETHPTLEGMRQIVTLSFNHLHYYLKGCMMYLSIFPEDYVIVKDRLLRRWIAEGLVAEIRGLTLTEVAEAYYNELVSRSMIDRADDIITYYDGRVETCRVHDMMLEVMVSRSLESNFVSLVGGSYEGMSYDRIRRLSIHGGEEATEDSPSNNTAAGHSRKNGIEGVKMEHVRSLSMFGPEDHAKVLDRLDEFTLLRVLDLEECMGVKNEHMRYVCRMYLLRFLSLKGTEISEMPEEVGELENLETLDARETYLKDLPKTVSKLQKLEHLQITNNENNNDGWVARQGQGRMKALRTVNKLVLRCDAKAAQEIGELQQLRDLNMIVDMEDKDMSGHLEVNQNLAESLSKMFSLLSLNIRTSSYDRNNAMIFLHDIKSPPQLLQFLRISGGIDKLPDWIGSLNNLVELFIAWTFLVGDQLFGPVCKLPNLKRLRLEMNCHQDRVLVAKTAHSFPALTHLYVDGNLEVLEFQKGSMAKLEILSAYLANEGSNRIDGMGHLANLKEVKLIGKKDNSELDHALKQLKIMNEKRKKSNQIKVVVKYD